MGQKIRLSLEIEPQVLSLRNRNQEANGVDCDDI